MYRLLVLLFVSALTAAGLPEWLQVYPGAAAETVSAPGMVSSTYIAAAKTEPVIEHYRRLWATAGLPFAANFNGVGTSIRAALAECDLLVQIREEGAGSHVRVSCAARNQTPDPTAGREVASSNGSVNGRRTAPRPLPHSLRDSHTAEVLAKAEAESRARTMRMGDFDQPVYPRKPRDPDGIPLRWPSWLVHMRGASSDLNVKAGKDQGGHNILTSTFRTTRPMTEIHIFYEDLMKANGFSVGQSRIQTGHTLGGIIQNANGMVKGTFQPNGVGGGGISTEARFFRHNLNDPIRVTLEVELIQIYSNRR